MVMTQSRQRGGFQRKVQLGPFIRDHLLQQSDIPHNVYIAYKEAVQSPNREFMQIARRRIKKAVLRTRRGKPHERVPVSKEELDGLVTLWLPHYIAGDENASVGGDTISFTSHKVKTTHCISYNGFMHYIYILRRLGLIEDTGDTAVALGKAGSPSTEWHAAHPSAAIRLTGQGQASQAWQDLWKAYRETLG